MNEELFRFVRFAFGDRIDLMSELGLRVLDELKGENERERDLGLNRIRIRGHRAYILARARAIQGNGHLVGASR